MAPFLYPWVVHERHAPLERHIPPLNFAVRDLTVRDLTVRDIDVRDLTVRDINVRDLTVRNIDLSETSM